MELLLEIAGCLVAFGGAGAAVFFWYRIRNRRVFELEMNSFWQTVSRGSSQGAREIIAELEAKYRVLPSDNFSLLVPDPSFALIVLDASTWITVRYQSLSAAESSVTMLLHAVNHGRDMVPYVYASTLYTHGCLLMRESSLTYAADRFKMSSDVATASYGPRTVYAVPPAVALSWLQFHKDELVKAANLLVFGLRTYARQLGRNHYRTVRLRALLALIAVGAGLTDEPRSEIAWALAVLKEQGLEDSPDAIQLRQALVWLDQLR